MERCNLSTKDAAASLGIPLRLAFYYRDQIALVPFVIARRCYLIEREIEKK